MKTPRRSFFGRLLALFIAPKVLPAVAPRCATAELMPTWLDITAKAEHLAAIEHADAFLHRAIMARPTGEKTRGFEDFVRENAWPDPAAPVEIPETENLS